MAGSSSGRKKRSRSATGSPSGSVTYTSGSTVTQLSSSVGVAVASIRVMSRQLSITSSRAAVGLISYSRAAAPSPPTGLM
jgi:hypothetical protein